MSRLFINGSGCISPQDTFGKSSLHDTFVQATSARFHCMEPDYSKWIDPKAIRRMSRIIRMGVASAKLALHEAGIGKPDGIVTATGLGCLDDTGIFLSKMISLDEESLNPTPFIQSTHNSIGSQIGLLLQCQGYNQTYVQRGFPFEQALIDAMMMAEEDRSSSWLVGAADEITDYSQTIMERFGIYKNGVQKQGEGAAFFVMSGSRDHTSTASLEGVSAAYGILDADAWDRSRNKFLAEHDVTLSDIDIIINGCDPGEVPASSGKSFHFKQLCGEYHTSSAFAFWLAVAMIRAKAAPGVPADASRRAFNNVLICNRYFGTHHSFMLLRPC